MADGYIFGNKFNSDLGDTGGQYFIIGRVKSIVMGPYIANTKMPDPNYGTPSDLGSIKYDLLTDRHKEHFQVLKWEKQKAEYLIEAMSTNLENPSLLLINLNFIIYLKLEI